MKTQTYNARIDSKELLNKLETLFVVFYMIFGILFLIALFNENYFGVLIAVSEWAIIHFIGGSLSKTKEVLK